MPFQDDPARAHASALAEDLRLIAGRLKRRLREETDIGDLSWSQAAVLGRLDRDGPATATALAKAEGMRPQSMGEILAQLKALGFIVGAPDPADGRQTILALTDACRAWVQEARAARQDWLLRTIQAQFTPDEQEQLAVGLALLKRLVEA